MSSVESDFKVPQVGFIKSKLPKSNVHPPPVTDSSNSENDIQENSDEASLPIEEDYCGDEESSSQPSKDLEQTVASDAPSSGWDQVDHLDRIPYKEPGWGGEIPDETLSIPYSLEVVRGGVGSGSFPLTHRSHYVIGRDSSCHITALHPSLSRHHVVLQYRGARSKKMDTGDDDGDVESGWYLYDLSSTHGTHLNKQRLASRRYVRIRVGHVIRLGGSSRLYILQGPPDDMEKESDFSVTELKEMRDKKVVAENIDEKTDNEIDSDDKSDTTCMWGMAEDAEDEDPSLTNPFSILHKSDLRLEDPRKSLKGWFEREGYDLQYNVEEVRVGTQQHFRCRIEVPIDSPGASTVTAEVTQTGKKKEVMAACAMEACRLLDHWGLLRQAKHESAKKKRKRSGDDGNESDDDFLDRTGDVARKRERRKIQEGELLSGAKNKVETYDTLHVKVQKLDAEIEELNRKLGKDDSKHGDEIGKGGEKDPLEQYMSKLKGNEGSQKRELQYRLNQIMRERSQLVKMRELAKPASLPPLIQTQGPNEEEKDAKVIRLRKIPGHTQNDAGSRGNVKKSMVVPVRTTAKQGVCDGEKEEEDDKGDLCVIKEDINNTTLVNTEEKQGEGPKDENKSDDKIGVTVPVDEHTEIRASEEKLVEKPVKQNKLEMSEKGGDKNQLERIFPTVQKAKVGFKIKDTGKVPGNYQQGEQDDKYDLWLPPSEQSGDGRTLLNEKLGY